MSGIGKIYSMLSVLLDRVKVFQSFSRDQAGLYTGNTEYNERNVSMAGKKILVVEDSPTQLKVTLAALEGQGYELLTAIDGKDALQKVLSERPDLVLLDVVMPIMDGFQVCRKMKTSPEMQHIPVIMLTSKNQKVDEFWGKKQGAELYLTKPFVVVELQSAVAKSLA